MFFFRRGLEKYTELNLIERIKHCKARNTKSKIKHVLKLNIKYVLFIPQAKHKNSVDSFLNCLLYCCLIICLWCTNKKKLCDGIWLFNWQNPVRCFLFRINPKKSLKSFLMRAWDFICMLIFTLQWNAWEKKNKELI